MLIFIQENQKTSLHKTFLSSKNEQKVGLCSASAMWLMHADIQLNLNVNYLNSECYWGRFANPFVLYGEKIVVVKKKKKKKQRAWWYPRIPLQYWALLVILPPVLNCARLFFSEIRAICWHYSTCTFAIINWQVNKTRKLSSLRIQHIFWLNLGKICTRYWVNFQTSVVLFFWIFVIIKKNIYRENLEVLCSTYKVKLKMKQNHGWSYECPFIPDGLRLVSRIYSVFVIHIKQRASKARKCFLFLHFCCSFAFFL